MLSYHNMLLTVFISPCFWPTGADIHWYRHQYTVEGDTEGPGCDKQDQRYETGHDG